MPDTDYNDSRKAAAAAALVRVRGQERQTVRALLRAEHDAQAEAQEAFRQQAGILLGNVAWHADDDPARAAPRVHAAIRTAWQSLPAVLVGVLSTGAQRARTASREDLASVLVEPLPEGPTNEAETAALVLAATAFSTRWGRALVAGVERWRVTGKRLSKELGEAWTVLLPQLARTVATETARAFNAERVEALLRADLAVELVWNAVLDRRVCPRCLDRDGEVFELDQLFERPPLHPLCRCVLMPLWPALFSAR